MTWSNYEGSRRALRRRIDELERRLRAARHELTMAKLALSDRDLDDEIAALLDSEDNK